jgi:hypothetical protein
MCRVHRIKIKFHMILRWSKILKDQQKAKEDQALSPDVFYTATKNLENTEFISRRMKGFPFL